MVAKVELKERTDEFHFTDTFLLLTINKMYFLGTSIPTKYTVCQDENRLSADSVQGLCYYLCHGYVRCNRTVSRPNCLMYAKLATDRARAYMKAAGNYIHNYRQVKTRNDIFTNIYS